MIENDQQSNQGWSVTYRGRGSGICKESQIQANMAMHMVVHSLEVERYTVGTEPGIALENCSIGEG